jgi:hypothetical protein
MHWTVWKRHFEDNRDRPYPQVERAGEYLPPAWRPALIHSLARFQVGEAGEGRIAQQIYRVQLAGIDDTYREALGLFVKEEGRHGRILGELVRALGGRLLGATWTERLFVFGRRLVGVRLKLLVLLAAEVIGIAFYGLLAKRLPDGQLRSALEQICADEADHLRFHCDFFRTQTPGAGTRAFFQGVWWTVGSAAALVVLLDHRRTLRALSIPFSGAARALLQPLMLASRTVGAPSAQPQLLAQLPRDLS